MVIYFCFIEKCTETQVKQPTNVVPSNTSTTGVRRVIIRTNGISKKKRLEKYSWRTLESTGEPKRQGRITVKDLREEWPK